MNMQELKKSCDALASQCAEADVAIRKSRKRINGAAPALERLARDLHRASIEVDILTAQILGDAHNKGAAA